MGKIYIFIFQFPIGFNDLTDQAGQEGRPHAHLSSCQAIFIQSQLQPLLQVVCSSGNEQRPINGHF